MASAAARTLASLTDPAQQFQLFHPIGGVSAMVLPQTIFSSRVASPLAFFA